MVLSSGGGHFVSLDFRKVWRALSCTDNLSKVLAKCLSTPVFDTFTKKKDFLDLTIYKLIVEKGLRSYNNRRNMSSAYCVHSAKPPGRACVPLELLRGKKSVMLSSREG